MTASTPDTVKAVTDLREIAEQRWEQEDYVAASFIQGAISTLAAVTAERDQAVAIVHDCERDMKALRGRIHELTADRMEAVENARASQQMHEQARSLLDQTLAERDQARAYLDGAEGQVRIRSDEAYEQRVRATRAESLLDQARQMLADAPHQYMVCQTYNGAECTCWKAGIE